MISFSELKAKQLSARRARKPVVTKVLTSLIGDLETLSKTSGHEPTEQEVQAMVKKFLKGVTEYLTLDISEETKAELEQEKALLESLMPKQATQKELKEAIAHYISTQEKKPNMGQIMSYLRGRFLGNYDGKLASELVNKALK